MMMMRGFRGGVKEGEEEGRRGGRGKEEGRGGRGLIIHSFGGQEGLGREGRVRVVREGGKRGEDGVGMEES